MILRNKQGDSSSALAEGEGDQGFPWQRSPKKLFFLRLSSSFETVTCTSESTP